MRLYCATSNPGKLREFRLAAERLGPGQLEIEPLPGLSEIPAPEEQSFTFEENAIAKAFYYSRYTPEIVFADDSGLAVNALGGAPGVLSARFAGPGATDEANNRLLLEKMHGVKDRTARFVCAVALVQNGQSLAVLRGEVEGWLTEAPRGNNGFGYDPLFFCPGLGCTFAEANIDQKAPLSHRGVAIEAMLQWLAARRR